MAKSAGVVDEETAVQYMAPFFKVQNPADMLRRLREDMQAKMDQLDSGLFKAMKGAKETDLTEPELPMDETATE